MSNNVLTQLAVFVILLIVLKLFFHLHISIIGSLLLTLALSFAMRMMQAK